MADTKQRAAAAQAAAIVNRGPPADASQRRLPRSQYSKGRTAHYAIQLGRILKLHRWQAMKQFTDGQLINHIHVMLRQADLDVLPPKYANEN